jgi:hypothetical protein
VLCPTEVVPAPAPLERQADLASEDQARTTALDVLTAAGTDVTGADVQVVDAVTEWHVTVEPRVGDLLAIDLAATVAVGAGGRIEWASGRAGDLEDLGAYPLLDTRAALDRLNEGGAWGYATAGAEVAVTDTEVVLEVAVTDAEVVLVAVPSWDGSGSYLVPGYRFSAEDGSTPVVPAVADEALAAPPAAEGDPAAPAPAPAGDDPAPTTAEVPAPAAGEGTAPTTEAPAPASAPAPAAPANGVTPTTAEASGVGEPASDGPPG